MESIISYGNRISSQEYDGRVVELYSRRRSGDLNQMSAARQELDLTIDHRLGLEFPPERRDALWEQQQILQRHPAKATAETIIRGLLLGKGLHLSTAQTQTLVSAYGRVLNDQELCQFLEMSRSVLVEMKT